MDIDFHYSMTRALAQSAGFQAEDAQDIAYANQYVDDAWDVIPAIIEGLPEAIQGGIVLRSDVFSPVTTAHNDDTVKAGFLNAAQSRTYIPFHFLPEFEYSGSGDYDYRTRPNGEIARGLMASAVRKVREAWDDREQRTRYLIKLGIASHSYIDTWAHQDFSGRFRAEENAVTEIEHHEARKWTRQDGAMLSFKANLFATPIGHARAGYRPDMPHLTWRYRSPSLGLRERCNPEEFMKAAQAVFIYFAEAAGKGREWSRELEKKVQECIDYAPAGMDETNHSTRKLEIYPQVFRDVHFGYDRTEWRRKVLEGDLELLATSDPVRILEVESYLELNNDEAARKLMPKLKYKIDHSVGLRWLYFHMEALEQRNYVASRIKPLPVPTAGEAGNVVSNLKSIFEENVPREVEKYLKDSPVLDKYRRFFPVPTRITDKHRWIEVTVENFSPFDIVWTRVARWSTGRFWHGAEPCSIPSMTKGIFAACNTDDSILTGVGGAALFRLRLGERLNADFTIAFSHPQESGLASIFGREVARKCWATFGNDTEAAFGSVGEGDKTDENVFEFGDKSKIKIRLQSSAGARARVTITQLPV